MTSKAAALLAACVSDAAARPLHWIYNVDKINDVLNAEHKSNPEFFPESKSPFYSLKTGENSCYIDEAKVRGLRF